MKRSFQLWILSITLSVPFKPEHALLLFLHKNQEPVLKRCFLLSCSSTKYDQTFSICSHLPNMSGQLPLLLPSLLHPPALCHVTSNCHRTNITLLFELVHILHKGSCLQIMLHNDSWMQMDANMSPSSEGVFVNEQNSRRLDLIGCLYFGYIAIEQEGYWVQT